MNLIILTDDDACGRERYCLRDHRAEHIREILKLKAGDPVEVGRLNGPITTAEIADVTAEEVIIETSNWQDPPIPDRDVILICALPRPQTLKKILITSAMMGVKALHLVRANRVERSYYQSPLVKAENQRPYLIEGLAQGRFTRLPEVTVTDRFRPFFEDKLDKLVGIASVETARLLADRDTPTNLARVWDWSTPTVTIAIGPEGGWVPFEIDLMKSVGFRPFSLGPWILRVEHAVTATLAQLALVENPD